MSEIQIDFISKMSAGRMKNYLQANLSDREQEIYALYARENDFEFDEESGLFVRYPVPLSCQKMNLNYSVFDLVLPRPSDLHYHTDVNEEIFVANGKGFLQVTKEGKNYPIEKGQRISIPKGDIHGFTPSRVSKKEDVLELRVFCSGILHPEQEFCVTPFYER